MVLALILAAHVVLKIALFPQVAHAPLLGDEAAYVDGARALSNMVRDLSAFGPVDGGELRRNVVGNGWFMPGMSVLLTPLFVVDPDASVTAIRAYLGVASSLILVLTALSVRRVLGDLYAGALLVFPGLVPMWLLFSYGAWGDLPAGLLILVLVMQLIAIVRRLRDGTSPDVWQGVRLGLVAMAVVYLRSSTTLLVAGMCIMVVAAMLALLKGRERVRSLGFLAAAIVVFSAFLLPWSVFASQTLGGRVVTTTSVPVVLANTFGDRDRLCFGECDPGSTIWFNPLRYSREVARATGRSEIEVQAEMSAYARSDVTSHSYARDVLADLRRYTEHPAEYSSSLRSPEVDRDGKEQSVVVAATNAMFFTMLAIVAAMMLAVFRKSFETQVVSIMLKLGLGALFTQPFVHISGSRYWTSAAPLFALAAALLAHVVWERRIASGPDEIALTRVLTAIQVVLVAATVLVAVGIVALAH